MAKKPAKGSKFTIDLAKSVMRSNHADGGVAYRKHLEGGGDSGVTPTATTEPAQPTESDYTAAINKIFQQDFGRAYNPDTDSWWLDQLKSGKESLDNLSKLETDIKSGATGADKSASTYLPTLQNLYQQDFGRAYNPATDSWWLQQLASGAENPANLAKDIISGAQGRDKLYYNTYNTPQQTQVVTPVQQNKSGYVGIPTGRTDLTPFVGPTTGGTVINPTPAPTAIAAPTTVAPSATQQYGTYAGPGTTPSEPVESNAQNYANTPWSIHNVQNYMAPNPMLGYQFNAPNLISAPLMNQALANSGGAGSNYPAQTSVNAAPSGQAAQQPAYVPPTGVDMTAYQNAYNNVMTNPTYVGTNTPATDATKATTTVTKPAVDTTTTTPTFTSATDAMNATADPKTAAAAVNYLTSLATKESGLPAASFGIGNAASTAAQQAGLDPNSYSSAGFTPTSQLPSQSPGYLAHLAAIRSDPVLESGLQGAVKAGIPGFTVAKRGGRINDKNKPSTGTFIKKALMVVSKNRPSRSQRKG